MIGTLLIIGAIYGGCLGAVVVRARDAARAASNARTLQSLRMALQMYADLPENQNAFPDAGSPAASLALLYPKYVADMRIFLDVRDPDCSQKSEHLKHVIEHELPLTEAYDDIGIGYEAGTSPIDPMAIVLYEKAPVNGRRNVCNVGGTVESMDEREFQRAIQHQRDEWWERKVALATRQARK
jgi:hypothetical protein